jgi:hypothetical protein
MEIKKGANPKERRRGLRTYPFEEMNVNDFLEIGQFSIDLMRSTAGYVAYFNKSRKPKRLVQRKKENLLIVIRTK